MIIIKSKEEIEKFKYVGQKTREILLNALNIVKANITTKDINDFVKAKADSLNLKPAFLNYRGFPAAICSSVNNILVHGVPNNIPLKKGDILTIDIGMIDGDGFIGDTAETIVVDDQENSIIVSCRAALNAAIEVCKPGNNLRDIGSVISKVAKMSGFSLPQKYGGHGVEKGVLHAEPFVSNVPEQDLLLRKGMVLAIEPMFVNGNSNTEILDDNWSVKTGGLSAHVEHMIAVDEKPIILTEA